MTSPITKRARELRKNPTDAEKTIWRALRESGLPYRFRRQYPVGPYFADIACIEKRLIIEIDGGQHDASSKEEMIRTTHLHKSGYNVLRFWNNDVLNNIEGVMAKIVEALKLPPMPPRSRGGEDGGTCA